MKCFYHVADLDGHCSGAVVKHRYPDCELIGFNYGYEFPWDTIDPTEKVFMVDVSLPILDMVKLARLLGENGGHLIWIDHHIGVIREYNELEWATKNLFGGVLDDSKAACELVWEFLFPNDHMPRAVSLLGIYDTWRFTKENEREIKSWQYGMRKFSDTRPENAAGIWHSMIHAMESSMVFKEVMTAGHTIYDYQVSQNEKNARSCAFDTSLPPGPLAPEINGGPPPGLRCIAINSNLMNSDVFKSVYDTEKHDAMLCFYWSNRGFWRCSIYSDNPDIDCSVYAQSYGGGGHKGAAGFQAETLPFILAAKDRG